MGPENLFFHFRAPNGPPFRPPPCLRGKSLSHIRSPSRFFFFFFLLRRRPRPDRSSLFTRPCLRCAPPSDDFFLPFFAPVSLAGSVFIFFRFALPRTVLCDRVLLHFLEFRLGWGPKIRTPLSNPLDPGSPVFFCRTISSLYPGSGALT